VEDSRSVNADTTGRMLDDVATFLRRYMVMSEPQAVAVALWIAHTHALDAFDTSPYLAITSAEMRCGKSHLLELLELLAANAWMVITPSPAVVFRKIDRDRPTLLLDEVDAIFNPKANGNAEDLRALLNAGTRQGTRVPRCVGQSQQLAEFSVYCPKALAGIGKLPSTIADRSIPVRLKRKARGETVERFRRRNVDSTAELLYMDLSAWGEHAAPRLADARPALPDELNDRAQDAWEPLLAIADAAGGDWPARARTAALELVADAEPEDESAGIRLLADIRSIFDERSVDRLASAVLVDALAGIEEAPWGEWYGKPITKRAVARFLSSYKIKPKTIRVGDQTPRGYRREQFEDTWARYLPETGVEPQQAQHPHSQAPLSEADVAAVALPGLSGGDM
jgi:hypothetical protein